VSGRTPHERRLCRLAQQCAEHVRVELRCSSSGLWPGGFVEAVRVKRRVVERAASDWTRQYATEREGELSVMHNVGLIRLALGRFGMYRAARRSAAHTRDIVGATGHGPSRALYRAIQNKELNLDEKLVDDPCCAWEWAYSDGGAR
jgi:hypothetical protein